MANFFEKYAQIVGQDKVDEILLEGKIIAQIKRRRKEKGITQNDLAILINVPKSTIGRIEAGMTSPRTETLLKISRALDIALVIDGREPQIDFPNVELEPYKYSKQYIISDAENNEGRGGSFATSIYRGKYMNLSEIHHSQYDLRIPIKQKFDSKERLIGVAS